MKLNLNVQERKVLIISLLSILIVFVTFGILSSAGEYYNKVWNLGGAIVGCLITLYALNRVYGKDFQKTKGSDVNSITSIFQNSKASAILIEGHDKIVNAMIQVVLNANNYLYTIGGRTRDVAYLDAIKRRLSQKDLHHVRIITGNYIRHSLCKHLHELLNHSEFGYFDEDRFGNVLVSHDTTLIALPSPTASILNKAIVIYDERVASEYRAYIAELLGSSSRNKPVDSMLIRSICEKCRNAEHKK